ncbi:hypothetical protein FA13DRAFT_754803 [Coprinellus micaceus]|uniref:Uncharacterized protein n=1 Tax=Coprinellus micaceus TaxID=71717 RepID=A0A4Y7TXY3_COPMI|nr:hypothetical protein FA13DRAFT_754803 [Coprinellus micaceus]
MMFEAFGFTGGNLHWRKLSQLPSVGRFGGTHRLLLYIVTSVVVCSLYPGPMTKFSCLHNPRCFFPLSTSQAGLSSRIGRALPGIRQNHGCRAQNFSGPKRAIGQCILSDILTAFAP